MSLYCQQSVYAVLFNDANGELYQWRRDDTGRWNNDGAVNLGITGGFTAGWTAINNGGGTACIFTIDVADCEFPHSSLV